VTGLRDWTSGDRGSIAAKGRGFYLFFRMSGEALGNTWLPVEWYPCVNRPGRECDKSPLSGAKVRNA
jgi:hypothetical protein